MTIDLYGVQVHFCRQVYLVMEAKFTQTLSQTKDKHEKRSLSVLIITKVFRTFHVNCGVVQSQNKRFTDSLKGLTNV